MSFPPNPVFSWQLLISNTKPQKPLSNPDTPHSCSTTQSISQLGLKMATLELLTQRKTPKLAISLHLSYISPLPPYLLLLHHHSYWLQPRLLGCSNLVPSRTGFGRGMSTAQVRLIPAQETSPAHVTKGVTGFSATTRKRSFCGCWRLTTIVQTAPNRFKPF